MASNSASLEIDFAAIAGEESSFPKGAAESVLERIDPSKPLEEFSCRDDLTMEQRADMAQRAKVVAARFKADRTELSSFGDGSLDGLNNTVTKILAQQGNLRIPEVERVTKEMAKTVANFRRKYKNSDPQFLSAIEKFTDSIAGIFTAGRQFFEELYIDSQSAVKRLDGVAAKLVEHKHVLERNVLLCDELYADNEKAMKQLIGTIAMMEEILEILGLDAKQQKIELDAMPASTSVERRRKDEELAVLLEMLEELEIRRSEFVARLFVAWSTSPQIRNLRKVSNSLAQRLHLLVVLTIPTMKLTIAQWGMMLQMEEAARAGATVAQANNDALQEYAKASGEVMPRLAKLAQTPSYLPETIFALADSVVLQDEGMVIAIQEGQRMRAELGDSVAKAVRTINTSGEKLKAEVIELLVKTKEEKPLELEAVREIPEAVIEYSQSQQAA